MKLIEVAQALATDEQCLAYLENRRWPNSVRCLTCGSKEISRITRKVTKKSDNKRAQLYQCLEPTCKSQFSATIGTIFHDSPLPLIQIVDSKQGTLYEAIAEHVDVSAQHIVTDDAGAYNFRLTKFHNVRHSKIRHSAKEYVKGEVHTNTVQNAFSLLKRAVIGTYHQLSIKHLQRYLNEFGYRFNRREDADIFEQTVSRMAGIAPMPYRKLVEQNRFTPFVRHSSQ